MNDGTQKPSNINLLISGFNRGFDTAFKSLELNLIQPLENSGFQLRTSLFLGHTFEEVSNQRSGEKGSVSVPDLSAYPRISNFEIVDQKNIDFQIDELFQLAMKNGNPWPGDNFSSLKNLLRFLYVLRLSYKAIDGSSDVTVFVRPDLFLHDKVNVERYFHTNFEGAITPLWQQWGGLNDRFAILSPIAAPLYLKRFDVIHEYLGKGLPLHSETFLQDCLSEVDSFQIFEERFSRVRIGDRFQNENFLVAS